MDLRLKNLIESRLYLTTVVVYLVRAVKYTCDQDCWHLQAPLESSQWTIFASLEPLQISLPVLNPLTQDRQYETYSRRTIVGIFLMFETHDEGNTKRLSTNVDVSPYKWEYVIRNSLAPWLLVTAQMTNCEGDTWTKTFMLTDSRQLHGLLQTPMAFLQRVQLLRPNFQKVLGWQIDDVLRIRTSISEHDTNPVEGEETLIEYEFWGGEKCTYLDGKRSNVHRKDLTQLYSILSD